MKSLHVSDLLDSGGAEAVFRDTVRAAQELNHDTRVMVSDGRRSAISYVWSVRWYRRMQRVLKAFQPDVIHVQNYYRFLSPSVLLAIRKYKSRRPHVRVIFTAHDYHVVCPNSGLQHFPHGERSDFPQTGPTMPLFARFDERSVMHGMLKSLQHIIAYRVLKLRSVFDVLISPSETLAGVFRAYGVGDRIVIVRNPVDSFVPMPSRETDGDLVYMGRVAPEKGLVPFVEMLENASIGVAVDVYGTGVDVARLENAASNLHHVRLRMHHPVPRSELPAVLSKFRALIYPSAWVENAPIVVVEAISAGLPCVVPDGGGAAEMAAQGIATYQYAANDSSAAVTAVREALGEAKANQLRDGTVFTFGAYKRRLAQIYTNVA
ncbi:glycosyltransferase [Paramicrobacterium chengjingii]|uniref:glycosyltransferase n=1 Tax=Paramicrobacterium chengjingii TaxID=2769067 RepID=UPI00141EDD89|nr:glycosyltransferase [Microbacterium chengjingii]